MRFVVTLLVDDELLDCDDDSTTGIELDELVVGVVIGWNVEVLDVRWVELLEELVWVEVVCCVVVVVDVLVISVGVGITITSFNLIISIKGKLSKQVFLAVFLPLGLSHTYGSKLKQSLSYHIPLNM
jgi:hypothetical protein